MLVLRNPAAVKRIPDPAIRALVDQRFQHICEGQPYDYDEHGYMIVVEPGDTIEAQAPIRHGKSHTDHGSCGVADFSGGSRKKKIAER